MSYNNTNIDNSFIHNTLRAKSRTDGEQHLDTLTLASFSAREGGLLMCATHALAIGRPAPTCRPHSGQRANAWQ